MGWDTWLTCTSHAFSTEKQEIMGLLLGRWPQAEELARLAHNNRIIDKNTGSEAGAITDPGAALVAAHASTLPLSTPPSLVPIVVAVAVSSMA